MKLLRAVLPALCLVPASAQAGLEFCNQTDSKVSIAIGYSEAGQWVSEGWWIAAPGDCVTAVGGDLDKRYYYWRATAKGRNWEREDQRYMFCTSPEVFTIEGDEECGSRGYDREAFNEIDLGEATTYTMNLTASGGGAEPVPDAERPMTGASTEAPRGTFGEPYSITGVLSHCDYYDAGIGCTVLADGWSYLATSYDHTPLSTLEALDGLGVNVPISISGDMISFQGSEALVTIADWQTGGTDPWAATRAALQGFWISDDDSSYQVIIRGSTFEEYYDANPTDVPLTMQFGSDCTGDPEMTPAFNLVRPDGSDDRCMVVDHVGGGALSLVVMGVAQPLFFTRSE